MTPRPKDSGSAGRTQAAAQTAAPSAPEADQPLAYADLPLAPRRPEGADDLAYLYMLRDIAPALRDRHGLLLTFSLADLLAINGPGFRQLELETYALQKLDLPPIHQLFSKSMLYANGRRHKARRTPLARSFAAPLIEKMRPEIRAFADARIDALQGAGPVDYLTEIAGAVPARLIATVLGLPKADEPRFTQLVYSAVRAISFRSPEVMSAASADLAELGSYVEDLLEDRRRRPRADLLSRYIEETVDSPLDAAEIRIQIATLILAGADTTRLTLAMTTARLAQHPEQFAALRADPEGLKRSAAAEGLRYDPAVASRARVVDRPLTFAGVAVEVGQVVNPLVITALRDPAVYDEPDRFDIRRTQPIRLHPVFGGGPHRCLGEALAWLELEETLASLGTRLREVEIIGPPPNLMGVGAVREISPMQVALR